MTILGQCPRCNGAVATGTERTHDTECPGWQEMVREVSGSPGACNGSPPLMSAEERAKQVGGNHYKDFAIQPWDVILLYKLDFWEGNALKYLLRRKSARLEDLKKARHYLDEAIRQLETKP